MVEGEEERGMMEGWRWRDGANGRKRGGRSVEGQRDGRGRGHVHGHLGGHLLQLTLHVLPGLLL